MKGCMRSIFARIAGSLKQELYQYALQNRWDKAQSIYSKFPDMVRISLTASGDTALHVAVSAKSTTFVKGLVDLKQMNPKDLETPNMGGNTALCDAVIIGNGDFHQIMIEKNENLSIIPGYDGMLPVHLAVLSGHHKIVQDLCSDSLLQKMVPKDIERLFFMTISNKMYGVTTKLFEKYPADLAIARDDKEHLSALHMLARIYLDMMIESIEESQLELLTQKIWFQLRDQLEYQKMLEFITQPSSVLFGAAKYGNYVVLKVLISSNRELLLIKDPKNGRTLLHVAVIYRQANIFRTILRKVETVNLIIRAVDNDRNNVLHFAALQLEEASPNFNHNMIIDSDGWFFELVKEQVPPELRTMTNSKGLTPVHIYEATHKRYLNEANEKGKGIANSGMVVATLIATIAFAAALTVPGDHKTNNAGFIVFMLANAVALFTSSASIISFFSVFFSSTIHEAEFQNSILLRLILGYMLLFISIVAMVIAFAAAYFLIFDHKSKWVAYVVAPLGLLPIVLFNVLQFNLFDGFRYLFVAIFQRRH